jgi:methylase of polypeptide subunit release factors
MEVGHDQGEAVCALLRAAGLSELQLRKDISGIARFPLAKMPASSNSVGTAASL